MNLSKQGKELSMELQEDKEKVNNANKLNLNIFFIFSPYIQADTNTKR